MVGGEVELLWMYWEGKCGVRDRRDYHRRGVWGDYTYIRDT